MQFCLLSASKKQKITILGTQILDTNNTQQISPDRQHTPRDKLIKGLGVSLAKTPVELITPKAGTPLQFFFICVVLLFVLLSSQIICSAVVCVFYVDLFVCFVQNVVRMQSLVLNNGSS